MENAAVLPYPGGGGAFAVPRDRVEKGRQVQPPCAGSRYSRKGVGVPMKIVGLLALLLGLQLAASLLLVPALLGAFWVKKKVCRMDGEKWEAYFRRIRPGGWLLRLFAVFLPPLLLVSGGGYFLFRAFSFPHPLGLAAFTFCLGLARAAWKILRYRPELAAKLERLR